MKKIFYWMIGGVLLTTAAFFIPEQSGSIWPSLAAASVAAAVYLVVFLAVWVRKFSSPQKKKVVVVTCTVLLVFSGISAVISYEGGVRQQRTLDEIKRTIEQGISYSYIHKPLIKTFAAYYNGSQEGLGTLFVSRYDSLITEERLFQFGRRSDGDSPLLLHVAKTTADSVVIVAESKQVGGRANNFDNFSGARGKYQVRGILTSKGVDYERQN